MRPTLTSKLSLPARLKHNNNNNNGGTSNPNSTPVSRSASPRRISPRRTMSDNSSKPGLVLRANVLKGRNLAAKDRSGTSDPYLVLSLGDAKEATPTINKTLNPEWNFTLDMPIAGVHSLLLEVCCWDKDRIGKDYMGEFDVILEDVFQGGRPTQEPKWYPLESRRTGKKKSVVTGEILLQFSLIDASNPSATPEQIMSKFTAITGTSSPDEDDDDLLRLESGENDDQDDDESSDETLDESKKAEKRERRRKKLRLAKLRRKVKEHTYEFSDKTEVAGVLFLEIVKVTDLPPEKNVTRTSFDMDPFVVTSLGKKTYRTKVVNHNLNPIYEEKLVFQVLRHETNYSINFTVLDRDKFSGNDYIGAVNFPLDKAVSVAPEADPVTGLYKLPEPSDSPGITEARRSRFRLPMSRSSSAHSLSRLGRPSLKKENSQSSLSGIRDSNGAPPIAPTSNPSTDSSGNLTPGIPAVNVDPTAVDDQDLKSYTLPLEMKNKDRWEAKHSPVLYIRAKYLPYKALRQQFWRAMLKQYDADDSGLIDKVELTTMLDTLGSTLHESTIDGFFQRFAGENNGEELLSFDQTVICLEDQLQNTQERQAAKSGWSHLTASSSDLLSTPGTMTPALTSGTQTPLNAHASSTSIPALQTNVLGKEGEEGDVLLADDLAEDEKGEEHVVEIRECPICHQPRLNKKSDADIITHVATCASQDWRQVNNLVMAGFVTASQAQRKWYSKVITKISYGGYKLGANSANILVQDRITGQINEERMSVYVRLGIRLLYKGLKSNSMEKKRIRKLLRSLSFKQGKKYDDPASAAEIPGFIAFHQLDMSEVLLPTSEFKSFNEFFYRALKPEARPCSAPEDPRVIVSPADCRSVVFNSIETAQSIWVKGREFTVQRLLGDAYPEDAKRFVGGSLGIFRLAPQDYHRFHIPVDGVMDEPKTIDGEYYTVNPMAIRSALDVYGENIRVVVPIDSVAHGRVMVICIGAMMVGSTVITRKGGEHVKRAEELGYFKFGGSTLLLLFEPGQMKYDDDLVDNSTTALETLVSLFKHMASYTLLIVFQVRVGMSIGHSPNRAAHAPDMRKENPTNEEKQDAKRRIEGSLAPEGVTGPMPGAGM
ncbi:phosphatidylserine decarboxylase-domain-containing protein [Dendryphion nanum]|uniref:Phosphatidylserine decarboxylase proenzyme 2 n=1 Tax=Dendryphion nanum TaxID=256645 RepID=A0A9P9D7F8_9PLEO|nr:phosphatidylserine decarboxylase-domain-containing protein [Dendryphion nanum]